jgi:hypothetical protein
MHLPQGWRRSLLCVVMAFVAHPATAFNITIDYTFDLPANGGNNFFGSNNPQGLTGGNQAKAAFDAAASYYSTILTDTFDAIVIPPTYHSVTLGSTGTITWSWQEQFQHPSDTNPNNQVSVTNPVVGTDQYVIYAGARSLSGSEAGFGGSGGFFRPAPTVTGTGFTQTDQNNADTITANFDHLITKRGELSGFANWGGVITFDNDGSTPWFFNHLATPSGNVTDFYSVAIHELGHALGLGASSEWQALATGPNFSGPIATVQNNFIPVPLSPDKAHWANGTNSVVYGTTTPQETAMDPSIQNGTRKKLTALDAAGLQDIGWSLGPAPAVNGDYNNNGIVDSGDYALWRRFLGQNRTLPNRTASGTISGADYTTWRNNFGRVAPGVATAELNAGAVPEPASGLLALLSALFICFNRSLFRR